MEVFKFPPTASEHFFSFCSDIKGHEDTSFVDSMLDKPRLVEQLDELVDDYFEDGKFSLFVYVSNLKDIKNTVFTIRASEYKNVNELVSIEKLGNATKQSNPFQKIQYNPENTQKEFTESLFVVEQFINRWKQILGLTHLKTEESLMETDLRNGRNKAICIMMAISGFLNNDSNLQSTALMCYQIFNPSSGIDAVYIAEDDSSGEIHVRFNSICETVDPIYIA